MSYPNYLRARSRDCIRLAVDAPEEPEIDALIDLAADYQSCARRLDGQPPPAEDLLPAGSDEDAGRATAGWRRLFNW